MKEVGRRGKEGTTCLMMVCRAVLHASIALRKRRRSERGGNEMWNGRRGEEKREGCCDRGERRHVVPCERKRRMS